MHHIDYHSREIPMRQWETRICIPDADLHSTADNFTASRVPSGWLGNFRF